MTANTINVLNTRIDGHVVLFSFFYSLVLSQGYQIGGFCRQVTGEVCGQKIKRFSGFFVRNRLPSFMMPTNVPCDCFCFWHINLMIHTSIFFNILPGIC